jgi:hypothetical protein
VDEFIKQYKYNMHIAPNITTLSHLEKGEKESMIKMEGYGYTVTEGERERERERERESGAV